MANGQLRVDRSIANDDYIAEGDRAPRVLLAKMLLAGFALGSGDRRAMPRTWKATAGKQFGNAVARLQDVRKVKGRSKNGVRRRLGPNTKAMLKAAGIDFDAAVAELNSLFSAEAASDAGE